jgi:DNA-binding LacI/PurR family transcriptional regulator
MKNITIIEIAKLAEVSPSAVSLALNGRVGVSDETRERVIAIARKYGYKGLSRLSSKNGQKTLLFVSIIKHGGILNENHKVFVADYIDGAQMKAGIKGWSLEVVSFDSSNESKVIDYINSSNAAGAVILGTELSESDVSGFVKVRKPVVFIDVFYSHLPFDFVDMNNDAALFQTVSYLNNVGYNDLAFVSCFDETGNFTRRRLSFEKALRLLGIKVNEVFRVGSRYEEAYSDMLKIINKGKRLPAVILCANDIVAMGCIKALKEKGYSIPSDISVIGFDNLPSATMTEPPLTTIDVPKKQISSKAVSLLLQRIKEGAKAPFEKVTIDCTLIHRDSVKK